MEKDILQLFFPQMILEYFELKSYQKDTSGITIYLEEKKAPKGYSKKDIESKGFFEEQTVADFPLRGKPCSYKIKRRRWKVKPDGQIIYRDWNLVAKGTRITKEKASRLEGGFGTDKKYFLLNKIKAHTKETEVLWIFIGIHTSNELKIGRRMAKSKAA